MIKDILKKETQVGNPYLINGMQITPLSKSVRINPGTLLGALIWNRPHAVIVRTVSREYVLPIKDHTKRAQFLLLGIGLLGTLIARRATRKNK